MRRNSALALTVLLALNAAGCALEPDASLYSAVADPMRPAVPPTLPAYANIAQPPAADPVPVPGTVFVQGAGGVIPASAEVQGPPVSAVLDPTERQRTIAEMNAMAGRGQLGGPRTSAAELRRIQNGHGAAALADIESR